MGEVGYRAPQTCKIVGITYRQLDYWNRTDLVVPTLAPAKGSGTQRIHTFAEGNKVVVELNDNGEGMPPQVAARGP